jgi:hypothetical protein
VLNVRKKPLRRHLEAPRVGDKIKGLCKWKRAEYVEQKKLLRSIVARPKHVCLKCGRVADKKKWLCEPEDLK